MPMLNWMGREKVTNSIKDVAMKILCEDKELSYRGGEVLATKITKNTKERKELCDLCGLCVKNKSTVLDIHNGAAYVLLYNGILKDRSVNGGNVLTRKTLAVIQADLAGMAFKNIIVYGEACRLMPQTLAELKIAFRQTPYDLVTRR